jgi:hypothetical protein
MKRDLDKIRNKKRSISIPDLTVFKSYRFLYRKQLWTFFNNSMEKKSVFL